MNTYKVALKNTAALVASFTGEEMADTYRNVRYASTHKKLAKELMATRGYTKVEAMAMVKDLAVITKGYGFACRECDHDTCIGIRRETAEALAA